MENDVKRKNEKRGTVGVNVKIVNNKSNVKTLDALNGYLVKDAEKKLDKELRFILYATGKILHFIKCTSVKTTKMYN